MQHAERKRLEQNRALDALKEAKNSVDVDPVTSDELNNYYVQNLGIPSHKFNAEKFSKGFGDIIGRYHARALDLAQQQTQGLQHPAPLQDLGGFAGAMQLPPTPSQAPPPEGIGQPAMLQPPPAMDQLPPTMSSIPQAQLQAPQVQPRPFFDPYRGAELKGHLAGLEAQAKLPSLIQEYQARYEAERAAERMFKLGEIEDAIGVMKKYTGTPYEDEVRYKLGMAPRGGGSGVSAGRPITGAALQETLRLQGKDAEAARVDPNKSYNVQLGPDRATIVSFLEVSSPTVSSKQLTGQQIHQTYPDLARQNNIPNNASLWVPLHNQLGGRVVSFIPTTELATISQRPDIKVVADADGSEKLVITPVTDVTQRVPMGQPGGGLAPTTPPPAPGGTAAPGASAAPAGPGAPAAPLPPTASPLAPTRAGAGGSTSRVIATKPLSKTEFDTLNAAQEGLNKLQSLRQMLQTDPNLILKSAIPGSPGARTYTRFKKEMADIITRLRTGAALNKDEEAFYQSQLPGVGDVLSSRFFNEPDAVEKALALHEALFQRVVDQYGGRAAKPMRNTTPPPDLKGKGRDLSGVSTDELLRRLSGK